jgi:hypothetical protein
MSPPIRWPDGRFHVNRIAMQIRDEKRVNVAAQFDMVIPRNEPRILRVR